MSVIADQDSIWKARDTANERYTKDLEDILRRIVDGYIGTVFCMFCGPFDAPPAGRLDGRQSAGHYGDCLLAEAEALLERTDLSSRYALTLDLLAL